MVGRRLVTRSPAAAGAHGRGRCHAAVAAGGARLWPPVARGCGRRCRTAAAGRSGPDDSLRGARHNASGVLLFVAVDVPA
jgi:hypothetical protein